MYWPYRGYFKQWIYDNLKPEAKSDKLLGLAQMDFSYLHVFGYQSDPTVLLVDSQVDLVRLDMNPARGHV